MKFCKVLYIQWYTISFYNALLRLRVNNAIINGLAFMVESPHFEREIVSFSIMYNGNILCTCSRLINDGLLLDRNIMRLRIDVLCVCGSSYLYIQYRWLMYDTV